MSEVTAKDLREVLESTKFYHWDKEEVTQNKSKQLNYLAAFDAMAEKAEAFDFIESLFPNGVTMARNAKNIAFMSELNMWRDTIGARSYSTLAEALKAVTE